MATAILMPQLGLTMEEGTVGSWLKNVGDTVSKGESLIEITTDKLSNEIESEVDGVLLSIVANEGDDVPVKGILGYIGQPGEVIEEAGTEVKVEEKVEIESVAVSTNNETKEKDPSQRMRISPLARKAATKLNVEFENLDGSGPGGRIIYNDILEASKCDKVEEVKPSAIVENKAIENTVNDNAAVENQVVVNQNERREKITGMRKVVAKRMLASHSEIPSVTQSVRVDVTKLLDFRKMINEGREKEDKFSINDLILKALSKVLANNKHMLASIDGEEIVYKEDVNIGMAVALEEGLIVPVIKNADILSLGAISKEAKSLAKKAREGTLSMEEYQDSTFSISNLGMYSIDMFTPIINQPNSAILGVCDIEDVLALVDETVVVKKMMRIVVTFDHRLFDGAVIARFQLAIKELLENPMSIVL